MNELEAIRKLEQAAREVDGLVSNDGPPFLYDLAIVEGPGEVALLELHDALNDLALARLTRSRSRLP